MKKTLTHMAHGAPPRQRTISCKVISKIERTIYPRTTETKMNGSYTPLARTPTVFWGIIRVGNGIEISFMLQRATCVRI